jgi:hypothetical protein
MGHNGIQGMPKRGREWVEWSGTAAAAAAVATGGEVGARKDMECPEGGLTA